jgi:hypothetical protein
VDWQGLTVRLGAKRWNLEWWVSCLGRSQNQTKKRTELEREKQNNQAKTHPRRRRQTLVEMKALGRSGRGSLCRAFRTRTLGSRVNMRIWRYGAESKSNRESEKEQGRKAERGAIVVLAFWTPTCLGRASSL